MKKYALSSRILHWIMALLIIALLALGVYMTNFLDKSASNRFEIYSLHKSLGVVALALIIIRIFNRAITKAPALPKNMFKIEKILAKITHFTLYLLMLVAPLSGYLMSNSYGYGVHLFSIKLPFLIEKNLEIGPLFSKAHYYSTNALIALIAIHILAVIKHRFFDKNQNDVLKRMI